MTMRQGKIVDSTLLSALSSTKNKDDMRDPEMHQTKQGNQWYFGMKAHIGVDKVSGLIHSVVITAVNMHDLTPLPNSYMVMMRWFTAMPATKALPREPRWQGRQRSFGWRCDRGNAEHFLNLPMEVCKN